MAGNYDVVNVGPTILDGRAGQSPRGVLVTFVTKPSGLDGELRVPEADATPSKLGPLLDTAAATLEAIKAL